MLGTSNSSHATVVPVSLQKLNTLHANVRHLKSLRLFGFPVAIYPLLLLLQRFATR